MLKKSLSIFVTLTMIVSLFMSLTITVRADDEMTYWSDNVASGFEAGTGSASDPYQIASAAQLAYFAAQVNAGNTFYDSTNNKPYYVELTNNIDLSDHYWIPIGGMWSSNSGTASGNCFKGVFNGYDESEETGYSITGLNVLMGKSGIGLFGYVNGGTLANVTVSGEVSTNGGSYSAIGGLVGYTSGNLVNCVSSVVVKAEGSSSSNVGSLAGIVENTTTAANLTSTKTIIVQNCSSSGNVTCNGTRYGGMLGGAYAKATGGILVDRCSVTGGTITGSMSAYKTYLGGLAGYCEASLSNCIVGANVTVNPTSGADGHRMGGIVGILSGYGTGKGRMAECVFLGTLVNKNANSAYDGVLCVPESGTVVANCFYYSSAGSQSSSYNPSNVYGLNNDQMKSIDTVDGTNKIGYFLNMSTVPAWKTSLSGAWTCTQGSAPVMSRITDPVLNATIGNMGAGSASTGDDSVYTTSHTYVYYDSTASSSGSGTASAPFNSFSAAVDSMVENNNEKDILIVKSPIAVSDYNLYGSSLNNKTIGRSYTFSEPIFTVGSNETLQLESITIDGNTNTSNNESLIKIDGGELIMGTGSVLTNNKTMSRDSAVRVDSGTFTMNGGSITGNTSTLGGIIYVGNGMTFTYSGSGVASNQVVYLDATSGSTDTYVTLSAGISNLLNIKSSGTLIAKGTWSSTNTSGYQATETDADSIQLNDGNNGVELDNNYQIVVIW